MITAFIIWLVKKYLLPAIKDHQLYTFLVSNRKKAIKLGLLLLFSIPSIGQQYQYNVLYKGKDIGDMYLTQFQTGDDLNIKMTSNIRMKMLMSVSVYVAEEASYKKDKLIYSMVYRKVNGKEKANRQTKFRDGSYEIVAEGKKNTVDKTGIYNNLARLYRKEPVNIKEVYSDAFQQFFTLEALGDHRYRLALPNGHYNVYHYQNGICNKVDVHSTFFTVQMQLAQNSKF